jgi:hypothetical protein
MPQPPEIQAAEIETVTCAWLETPCEADDAGSYKGSFDYASACAKRATTCSTQDDKAYKSRSGEGSAGGLAGCGFVIRGIQDYTAVETLAVAFGAEIGLIPEREMNDTALAR